MTETEKELFLSELYLKYYDDLKFAAILYGARPIDADDFVQEVFLTTIRKFNKFINYSGKKAWLLRVLINNIRNYRRLHATKFNCSLEECGDLAAPEQAEPLSHILPSQLSDSEKQLLIWRYEIMMDYKEMSRRLGITEQYYRVKLSRIRKKCLELMEL